MPEYIERETAMSLIDLYWQQAYNAHFLDAAVRLGSVYREMEDIPAADVRPVVLCRDCKWCHAGYCEKYDDLIPFGCANKPWEDWFCADGAMLKK
jgi:hypothetical protein